jgi:hypothetical protein
VDTRVAGRFQNGTVIFVLLMVRVTVIVFFPIYKNFSACNVELGPEIPFWASILL